jgi:hypothetical protein
VRGLNLEIPVFVQACVWKLDYSVEDCSTVSAASTVASRPKILQNNSKPAVEKIVCRGKLAAVRLPFFGEKRPKKNFCVQIWFLRGVFASKCEFVTTNF